MIKFKVALMSQGLYKHMYLYMLDMYSMSMFCKNMCLYHMY